MKVYDAASIRNVALVGHTGSGKTQLASAILSDAGMVSRFGKVDDGTTATDFDVSNASSRVVDRLICAGSIQTRTATSSSERRRARTIGCTSSAATAPST